MNDVTGVRARPGGRVTLRFNDNSYRAIPYPKKTEKTLDVLLGDAMCGISVVVVLILGIISIGQLLDGSKAIGIALAVVAAPFVVLLLIRSAVEIGAHAMLLVAVGAALVLAPLLLVPRVRHRVKRWWNKEPAKTYLNRRIYVTELEPVEISGKGVVVMVGNQRIRYTAGEGDRLAREFRTMMQGSAAAGVGP